MRRKSNKAVKPKSNSGHVKEIDGPVALALSYVDAILERIISGKLKKFDDANLTQLCKLDKKQLAELNAKFKLTSDDLKGALDKDPYCLEMFSPLDTDQLKLMVVYLKAIRSIKPDAAANGKIRVSHQRKKRIQSPEKVTRKVLFMEHDKETGQRSLSPIELVGSAGMWIFNTKTRKLGCYHAKNDSGLTAKGTTILNYDEDRSTTKTIRKPMEQIKEFMRVGRKFWEAIRAVPQPISPRLSRETLILRIDRST